MKNMTEMLGGFHQIGVMLGLAMLKQGIDLNIINNLPHNQQFAEKLVEILCGNSRVNYLRGDFDDFIEIEHHQMLEKFWGQIAHVLYKVVKDAKINPLILETLVNHKLVIDKIVFLLAECERDRLHVTDVVDVCSVVIPPVEGNLRIDDIVRAGHEWGGLNFGIGNKAFSSLFDDVVFTRKNLRADPDGSVRLEKLGVVKDMQMFWHHSIIPFSLYHVLHIMKTCKEEGSYYFWVNHGSTLCVVEAKLFSRTWELRVFDSKMVVSKGNTLCYRLYPSDRPILQSS